MIKKKSMAAFLLAGIMTISACTAKEEEQTTTAPVEAAPAERVVEGNTEGLTPAVWQVTDPESGNSIKMMGTIHIIPETNAPVPQYVMDIYNESDGIAVEYDVTKVQTDMVVQLTYLSYFVLDDGTLITDHLTPENYEKAKAKLTELNLYNEAFDSYNAAYWESLLTSGMIMNVDGMSSSGIDQYFLTLAKEDGKYVWDIEELEDQMNALTASTDGLSNYNISEMLSLSAEEYESDFMELYNMWATGDVDGFEATDSESVSELPAELEADYANYENLMLTVRNEGMAEKAAEYIENGDNVFYMVGFAHFCGDGSVIDLLAEQGYTVERIH